MFQKPRITGLYSYVAFSLLILMISIASALIAEFLHNMAADLLGPGSVVVAVFYYMMLICLILAAISLAATFGLSIYAVVNGFYRRR